MPANLTPQYREAEKRYRTSRTVPEKIAALQEMLAVMPKHKGTDHLKADLRAKMAKLLDELERPSSQRAGRTYAFALRKEGAGQAVLLGLPNSGKSSLLAALTGSQVKIAPYPFTTQLPTPGMVRFEDVHIQLLDTPPMAEGRLESKLYGLMRTADVLIMVVDLGADALGQAESVVAALADWGMEPLPLSRIPGGDHWQAQKRMIIAANKCDLPDARIQLQRLFKNYSRDFSIVMTSATGGIGLDDLAREIFRALSVIRVYTKAPNREAEMERPMVMPTGSTVEEAAVSVHKDWQSKLKYALLWGSGKFAGQRVGRDYTLEDCDVLELHG